MTRQTPRRFAKQCARFVASVLVFPLIAAAKLEAWLLEGEGWFSTGGAMLSLVPGKPGEYLRLAFYRFTLQECSFEVVFSFGTVVNHRGTEIGCYVNFGSRCNIGTATIGDHVLIASGASILSGLKQHNVADATKNITEDEPVLQRVHIGCNTWVGEGAIIGADVGDRCVVAAGSVVFRPVPEGKMAIGNPARAVTRWPGASAGSDNPTSGKPNE